MMAANTENNQSERQTLLVKSFISKAEQFMKKTEQHSLQGVNPGSLSSSMV
jgi:hypothetical protein